MVDSFQVIFNMFEQRPTLQFFSCSRKIKLRIRRARGIVEKLPIAYIPLGIYEWHGELFPVGLNALTAPWHLPANCNCGRQRCTAAMYYGCGGGHRAYPWTIIPSQPVHIEPLLDFTLQRLETNGVKLSVLFSGHFAPTQLDMIDRLAQKWNDQNRALRVFATAVNRVEGLSLAPDHAGIFETTLLSAIWPELIHLNRLPSLNKALLQDNDVWEAGRHDPKHPIWGVVGPDPRHFKPEEAEPLLDATVAWLIEKVHKHF